MLSRSASMKTQRLASRVSATYRRISTTTAPLLLSPAQLRALSPADVAILDASWFMPNSRRNPSDEFISKRILGSQYLDLDAVASPHERGIQHMMPQGRVFADACEKFGIGPSSHVVIYDSLGIFSSPRALFMFRAFGHDNSSVLDGGLPRWEAEGYPVENDPPMGVTKTSYPTPSLCVDIVKSYEQVVSNSSSSPSEDTTAQIVLDARTLGRYLGKDPEPRPGLSSGHIPHSFSLPFNAFLKTHTSPNSPLQYTTFLSPPEIHQSLVNSVGLEEAERIIKGMKPVITTCGSGMTAAILWLGLKLLGAEKVALYDESWFGYASRDTSKIVKSL